MKTILVPTDFSENSKSGMRFAIEMATISDFKLLFIHVAPLAFTEDEQFDYPNFDLDIHEQKTALKSFVEAVYQEMASPPKHHEYVIISGLRADAALLQYCDTHNDLAYICVSTKGANGLGKLLGTNTGNLISKSSVPVLVVPTDYRFSPVNLILYASDFKNYMEEIKQVVSFAQIFRAKIEALHFLTIQTQFPDERRIELLQKAVDYDIHFKIEPKDILYPLIAQLEKQISLLSPSVLVLFTEQHRSFLQKIFLSSMAEELAFHPTIPMLVFNKQKERAKSQDFMLNS